MRNKACLFVLLALLVVFVSSKDVGTLEHTSAVINIASYDYPVCCCFIFFLLLTFVSFTYIKCILDANKNHNFILC